MAIKKSELYSSLAVAHELVHFLVRKHDERFFALMDRHQPNWRQHRAELNVAPLAKESWSC